MKAYTRDQLLYAVQVCAWALFEITLPCIVWFRPDSSFVLNCCLHVQEWSTSMSLVT